MTSKTNRILSIFFGLFCGLFAYPVLRIFVSWLDALLLSVWCALACAVLLSLCLFVSAKHNEKRYAKAEAAITVPILLRTSGHFILPTSVRHGNIYLCPDRLVFICLDAKPPITQELLISDLAWREDDGRQLRLYTTRGSVFILVPTDLPLVKRRLEALVDAARSAE